MKFLLDLCAVITILSRIPGFDARTVNQFFSNTDSKLYLDVNSTCDGENKNFTFQKLLVHKSSIYIGSTNHVLQLDPTNFNKITKVKIGPQKKPVKQCYAPTYCENGNCGDKLVCANNEVRILASHRDRLLVCGSYYGVCDIFNLTDVSSPYVESVNIETLKCSPVESQIAATENGNIKHSIYQNSNNNLKDLLFVSQDEGFITTYPPIKSKLMFNEIDDTKIYLEESTNHRPIFNGMFSTQNHTFVLKNTYDEAKPKYDSVIARVCHKSFNELTRSQLDKHYKYGQGSYTETEVFCGEDFVMEGSSYYLANDNLVYAIFRSANSQVRICSANIRDINKHINEARRRCFQQLKGDLFQQSKVFSTKCPATAGQESRVTCGIEQSVALSYGHARKLKYRFNFTNNYEWTLPNNTVNVTSLLIDSHGSATIAFVTLTTGSILKIELHSEGSFLVEEIKLQVLPGDSPVLQDVLLDETNKELLAMTSTALYKVALEDCSAYKACNACLASKDPYCGWCVLTNSCTQTDKCKDKWLSSSLKNSSSCPSITVSPESLPVKIKKKLSISLLGELPMENYECKFEVENVALEFTSPLSNYTCLSPLLNADLLQNNDHVVVTVVLVYNDVNLASSTYDVYNCNQVPKTLPNSMCKACVISKYNCKWCQNKFSCQDDCGAPEQHNDPSKCPVINNTVSQKAIPVGQAVDIFVSTQNLPTTRSYNCKLTVCGSESQYSVPATLNGNKATCSVQADTLKCDKLDSKLQISLFVGDYTIDSSHPSEGGIAIPLYNCSAEEQQCAICVNANRKFTECAWCEAESKCIMKSQCSSNYYVNVTDCSPPIITSIFPLSGPTNGSTELTIKGSNLGSNSSDISTILINSIPCVVLSNKYRPGVQVVCVTQSTPTEAHGSVALNITYAASATSQHLYYFKLVIAISFSPVKVLGGTKVSVQGRNLNIGNLAKLSITNSDTSYNASCGNRSPNRLACVLPNVLESGDYTLQVSLDGFSYEFTEKVKVLQFPTIAGVLGRDKVKVFQSGGMRIEFQVSSLDGIQKAEIIISEQSSPCSIQSTTTSLSCEMPLFDMNSPKSRKRRNTNTTTAPIGQTVSASIKINGVHTVSLEGDFAITYYPDPVINKLTDIACDLERTTTEGNSAEKFTTINLSGVNLDSAAIPDDYYITIYPVSNPTKAAPCLVRYLDPNSMVCKYSVTAMENYAGEKVIVMVKIGNLTVESDPITYCTAGSQTLTLALGITIPILCILILTIVGLMIGNRLRNEKQIQENKRIIHLVEKMENKTRENARKAFSQLQLAYMTPLVSNISDQISYLPPVTCYMKALFNDTSEKHPVLVSAGVSINDEKKKGLEMFLTLLRNREFLLLFVRTLEDQRKFTVKEKGHVASLLTVCFFDDLSYLTKVMLELLSELIEKHVSKSPKLLLRRSESVVEKLVSHWLCIALYQQCIEEQAGKPLFLLTKSIHYLVTSAPCDIVANKSMNSLNEMTLLGSEIDYKTLTINATVLKVEHGMVTEPAKVTIVDCDTITQVKSKIIEIVYKDYPYNDWPKPDDLELELVSGGIEKQRVLLSDIDAMSHKIDGYTQINTIKHYNVPDQANVALSPASTINKVNGNGAHDPLIQSKKRLYHLIHPRDDDKSNGFVSEDGENGNVERIKSMMNRPFQEIYLTRMIKSKTTVQEYVDGVFSAILSPSPVPRAVNYFFKFLDHEALKHKVTDPEVVHIWKTNSLLLRYWVNILKNPEFIFDVDKSTIVDSCLNVITQAFMDACTTSNHKLGQDSPSNKLLYAKDAVGYKVMVKEFFENVSRQETVTYEEMCNTLTKESKKYAASFDKISAANEIFSYFDKYKEEIMEEIRNSGIGNLLPNVERVLAGLSPTYTKHVYENSSIV